ncbi:MAG: BNR repeat-containing protein [Deltaproteobacteria bacterium]|nr:BNR repeat-containing protein [Deltaproteobacteria bacterium]
MRFGLYMFFLILVATMAMGCGGGGNDLGGNSNGDVDSDADADADTDGDSDSDGDSDTDGDSDADGDTDADGDSDADTDADSDGDSDADTENSGCAFNCVNDCDAAGGMEKAGLCDNENQTCCDLGETESDSDTVSDSDSATEAIEPVSPGVTKDGEGKMTYSGLMVVSYGGYLNGESFQQDGILTYKGYQYTAFWNTNRNVVMARRKLPYGEWVKFDFTDYRNTANDAHNTISLGICPGDGTLHLSFDHHGNTLHYRRSVENLITDPEGVAWAAISFSNVTDSLVSQKPIALVTYPRFVTVPGGNRMLFDVRLGESGSGNEALWEYSADTHQWMEIGVYIDGISDSVNAYLHGIAYTPGKKRLHAAWCWRETPDAQTNHDLFYVYSDDNGRTWKNNNGNEVAVSGQSQIKTGTVGARVWEIGQNRGLINQEHMTVDKSGRVHVLLSHMPDTEGDDSDFTRSRTKAEYFHYWRDTDGKWRRENIDGQKVILNFRGNIAVSSSGNVYAILPGLRIAGASLENDFSDWKLLHTDTDHNYFSDPLIDTFRLQTEDKLTIIYPEASSVNIWGLEYTLN